MLLHETKRQTIPFLEPIRVLQANVPAFRSENLIGRVKKSPSPASWIETIDASGG